ncbi:MAG TPA: tRNA lysidine(34) synthetase TilS [Nakamurella sp.]|nr:tRNA lysidine(34) synthetase TilS [Nakamurella sp.]
MAAVRVWLAGHVSTDQPVVVACSGGADSLALAVAVLAVAGDRPVRAATVDHGLQNGSAERAADTARLLTRLGYSEVAVLPVTVEGPGGVEAAARRARYTALRAHAVSVSRVGLQAAVLLAHTLDDQAETVLLGLARGSGPRSIAGMRPWRPPWGRPLLTVTRADTERACRVAGLQPWEDPHNADPAFTRVRLRREVLPLLEEVLGGGVRAALARTASLMRDDLDALDEIAAAALDSAVRHDRTLDVAALSGQPAAVLGRVLRGWAARGGAGPLTFDHLTRMITQLTDPQGPAQVRVPGGLDVVRTGNSLRLRHIGPESAGPHPLGSPVDG